MAVVRDENGVFYDVDEETLSRHEVRPEGGAVVSPLHAKPHASQSGAPQATGWSNWYNWQNGGWQNYSAP